MSILYIGDRGVGKTHLAKRLTSPESQRVRVTNITEDHLDLDTSIYNAGHIQPTLSIETHPLEMQVRLLAPVSLNVNWIDTPGEIWRSQWQKTNATEWHKFTTTAHNSKGIVVLLPPYRNIGQQIKDPDLINLHQIPTQTQWCHRFKRWVQFFREHCHKVEHIVLCINKADLFCDLKLEADKLGYNPSSLTMDWVDRNNYIIDHYFAPIQTAITEINRDRYGVVVRCFITSIHNRMLIELPWIYLACYL